MYTHTHTGNQVTRGTNKAAKRKEWAAKKREKKKGERADRTDAIAGANDEDNALFEVDQPDFGEVAMAPPQLALKLRRPESSLQRKPLLLSDQLGRAAKQKRRTTAPHRAQTLAEERTRAIDSYRAMKANRSNGGAGAGSANRVSAGSDQQQIAYMEREEAYTAGGFDVDGDSDD